MKPAPPVTSTEEDIRDDVAKVEKLTEFSRDEEPWRVAQLVRREYDIPGSIGSTSPSQHRYRRATVSGRPAMNIRPVDLSEREVDPTVVGLTQQETG